MAPNKGDAAPDNGGLRSKVSKWLSNSGSFAASASASTESSESKIATRPQQSSYADIMKQPPNKPSDLSQMSPNAIEAATFTPAVVLTESQTPQPNRFARPDDSELVEGIESALPTTVHELQAEIKNLRQTNNNVSEAVKVSAYQANLANQQLSGAQQEIANLKMKLGGRENWKLKADALSDELRRSHQQSRTLEQKLEECKDKLFKVQPAKSITEVDISGQYLRLCRAIEDWAEQQFGDIQSLSKDILALDIQPKTAVDSVIDTYLFQTGVMQLLDLRPGASLHIIIYLIMANVRDGLFRNGQWTLGMDVADQGLLNDIVGGMEKLMPLRDTSTIGAWKSETYQALLKVGRFAQQQEMEIDRCNSLLGGKEGLLQLVSRVQRQAGFDERGLVGITTIAGHLMKMLASVGEEYWLDIYQFRPNDPVHLRELMEEETTRYDLIDASNYQDVPSSATILWDKDNIGGEKLCVIFPAMLKRMKDGSEKLVSKGKMLVRFDKPVQRMGA